MWPVMKMQIKKVNIARLWNDNNKVYSKTTLFIFCPHSNFIYSRHFFLLSEGKCNCTEEKKNGHYDELVHWTEPNITCPYRFALKNTTKPRETSPYRFYYDQHLWYTYNLYGGHNVKCNVIIKIRRPPPRSRRPPLTGGTFRGKKFAAYYVYKCVDRFRTLENLQLIVTIVRDLLKFKEFSSVRQKSFSIIYLFKLYWQKL